MKYKMSNILTIVICAAVLSVTSYHSGYAAADSGIQYNSQGKIVFDNGTDDIADDVVFDASDFLTIDSMVTRGKTAVKNELNQYEGIEINEDIPAFDTLAASVSALADGTDAASENILTGKKALVGKNIVTGTMTDHSGDQASADNIRENENGTMVEVTIPGGYYDEESKVIIPIDTIEKLPTINSKLDTYPDMLYAMSGSMPNGDGMTCYLTLKNPNINKYKRIKYTADSDNGSNTFVRINGTNVNGTGYINVSDSVSIIMRTDSSSYKAPSCTLYWST